ncbi:hypothetical protein CC2G_012740 [Coprinopsis cinerea AmutBmut pab1-1]|nr:hypothetical protein CC2G_012740 [Coprinopsis cinerea AmutBmut pab1-1]
MPLLLLRMKPLVCTMHLPGFVECSPIYQLSALTDVLTPTNLAPLFNNHPELIPTLFPHLPSDLPVPPSAEALQRVVNSTQFKAAAASLDRALRTGLLGGFVRQLGLPEEAGLGLGPFLRAIQEQADHENRDSGNRMDTD